MNADERLIAAIYEAETYGIGATSDFNQKVLFEAARETQKLRSQLVRARKALEQIDDLEAGSRAAYSKFSTAQRIARSALTDDLGCSSAVERLAVNEDVAGSIPADPATTQTIG